MCIFCIKTDFSKYKRIECANCEHLEKLPKLSENLLFLRIQKCSNLKTFEKLPDSIRDLRFVDCQNLESLNDLSTNLETLICVNCPKITVLPNLKLFKNMRILDCRKSKLKIIPKFPDSLEYFDCSESPNLTSLPSLENLPLNLKELCCSECPLLKFPSNMKFPESLEAIEFDSCPNLVYIPDLPENLDFLSCSRTRISKMPTHSQAEIIDDECPWIDPKFPGREKRFSDLEKIQKSIKKYLYRRNLLIFSILKKFFPKDICGLISTF